MEQLIKSLEQAIDMLPDYTDKGWETEPYNLKNDVDFVKALLMREYFKVKAVAAEPVQNLVDLDAMLAQKMENLRGYDPVKQPGMWDMTVAHIEAIRQVMTLTKINEHQSFQSAVIDDMETKKQERRNG